MGCDHWTEKLDAYFDGELPADEARAVAEHLRGCAACAADGLSRVQQKLAIRDAGQRFTPNPAFRARIQRTLAPRRKFPEIRLWLPLLATAVAVLIAGALFLTVGRSQQQLIGELVDQHVATLASANPVDVVSTDRHTVKPWFAGKIPFTFNLPELEGSPFVLVGGRLSYLKQSPGAELIFRVRQHQISVFIFQDRSLAEAGENQRAATALSFQVRSWSRNGLRYFVIGDAGAQDLDRLSELMKAAG
jgi:anti-sigma factor RsiW